jgi:hypothetical protein
MINKTLVLILVLLTLSPLITSQDSFKIQNNQIIFTIEAPKEGIYGSGYIYQNTTKINTIRLCNDFKCYKTFKASINLNNSNLSTNKNIEYKLLYYDYSAYIWKNLSFQIDTNSTTSSKGISGQATQESKPIITKTTISIICGFYTLFDRQEYANCKQEYMSRI